MTDGKTYRLFLKLLSQNRSIKTLVLENIYPDHLIEILPIAAFNRSLTSCRLMIMEGGMSDEHEMSDTWQNIVLSLTSQTQLVHFHLEYAKHQVWDHDIHEQYLFKNLSRFGSRLQCLYFKLDVFHDEWMAYIAHACFHLESLVIVPRFKTPHDVHFSSIHLHELAIHCPRLQHVLLNGKIAIDDLSVEDTSWWHILPSVYQAFGEMKQLKFLGLPGQRYTEPGIIDLCRKLPQLSFLQFEYAPYSRGNVWLWHIVSELSDSHQFQGVFWKDESVRCDWSVEYIDKIIQRCDRLLVLDCPRFHVTPLLAKHVCVSARSFQIQHACSSDKTIQFIQDNLMDIASTSFFKE